MDVFLVFTRLTYATLLIFGAFKLSESFSFTKKPPRTVRVLEGASKNLTWDFTASASQYFVTFWRVKAGDLGLEQIAARNQDSTFETIDSYKNDYTALLPAKLLLKEVKRNEKYVYTIRIHNEIFLVRLEDRVTVEVVEAHDASLLQDVNDANDPPLTVNENEEDRPPKRPRTEPQPDNQPNSKTTGESGNRGKVHLFVNELTEDEVEGPAISENIANVLNKILASGLNE
ncbi:hypothetical protein ACROYT_G028404 [Oculina patagonica]